MTFHQLPLDKHLIETITKLGFETPTEIQQQAIPFILEEENDLIALAQTGTGKTAAFGLPILHSIEGKSKKPHALILCPTRELGIQIARELQTYNGNLKKIQVRAIFGGASINTQISELRQGADIVVGTPGRTLDLLRRKELKLEEVSFFVLDEADEMLNMGFKDELDAIINYIPEDKRTLLFSATFPKAVAQLSKAYLKNPRQITIGGQNTASKQITHQYCIVRSSDKLEAIKRIYDSNNDIYAIVFCRTKIETQEVAGKLIDAGYSADCIHGDLSQAQREHIIRKFKKKGIKLLIATDVVARGLDINNLTHVLNLNLPDDPEVYIHRSGRTGRAGKKGTSICIIHSREHRKLREIAQENKLTFEKILIPTGLEICQDLLFKHVAEVQDAKVSDEVSFYLSEIQQYFEALTKEEVIAKFVSDTFNQIIHKYKNTSDINIELGVEHQNDSYGRDRDRGRKDKGRSKERDRGDRGGDRRNSRENSRGKSRGKTNENYVRFHLNVGKNHQFRRGDIFGIINRSDAKPAQVGDIDIQNKFSFFEIEKKYEQEVKRAFKENGYNLEIAKPKT